MRQLGGTSALTGELKERDEVGAQPLIFSIGSSMCAAYIVDEVKASQSFGESSVSPEPRSTRILDDNEASIFPSDPNEAPTRNEERMILTLLDRVRFASGLSN